MTEGISTGVFRDVDPGTATLTVFGMCNWAQSVAAGRHRGSRHCAENVDLIIRGRTAPSQQPSVDRSNLPLTNTRSVHCRGTEPDGQLWRAAPTMRSSPAADVPGVNIAALTRYLPEVLDDYDPEGELSARLLAGGRPNLTCLLSSRARNVGCCAGLRWAT
jgi:hypothetical protein